MASHFFDTHIGPQIRQCRYRRIVEIGVDTGTNTKKLIEVATEVDAELICIDPSCAFQPPDRRNVSLIKGESLRVLKRIHGIDCVVLDGDHNWYTVLNELRLLDKRLRRGGTIFVHDVEWPYGRRDMYYAPRRVPSRFRHPFQKLGIVHGQSRLAVEGVNGEYFNAAYEGGSRNGVLTAVEDFLRVRPTYDFSIVHEEFGLGILRKSTA